MSELLLLLLDVAFVSTAPAAYIAQAFLQMLLVTLVWEASMHLPHARVALPIPSLNAKIALVIIALASSLVSLRARSLVVAYLNALALAGQRNSLLESIVRIIRPAPAAPTTKQTQPPMPQPQVTPFMSAISPPATRATQSLTVSFEQPSSRLPKEPNAPAPAPAPAPALFLATVPHDPSTSPTRPPMFVSRSLKRDLDFINATSQVVLTASAMKRSRREDSSAISLQSVRPALKRPMDMAEHNGLAVAASQGILDRAATREIEARKRLKSQQQPEPDATQSSATTAVPEVQASANESAVTLTLAPGHVSATPGHEQAPPTSQQTVIDGGTNALFSFPTVTGILATGSIASKPPLYPVAFPPAKEGTKKKVRSKPRS